MNPTSLLAKVVARQDLTSEEARTLFDALIDNQLEPPLVGGLLAALSAKRETVDEIVGAAGAMRARVLPVQVPAGTTPIDTCGTGGDGKPLFNVSTAVAIVTAAAGVTVAKHGNRSNARPSGSAEVLEALGVNIAAPPATVERCLAQCGVAFLFAPQLHPAMKHAVPIRRALGIQTIFNLVGPLTNPAGVRRQLVGVYRPDLVYRMLESLRRLGAERAIVAHGREGLCDISIAGSTLVGFFDGRRGWTEELTPGAVGLEKQSLDALFVRNPQESAQMIRQVLEGQAGPARDMVRLNTAAALWVAGRVDSWETGLEAAARTIDSGAAREKLREWVEALKANA